MWTAARLVAALLFAGIGWYAARQVTEGLPDTLFPEGLQHDLFEPSIAIIGLWQGWSVMGKLIKRGYSAAIGNGIRTSVQITLFGLVFYALREMFIRSSDLRYSDFGVAVMDALNLFIAYGGEFITVTPAILTLLVGGAIAGLVVEFCSKIWR